MTTQKASLLEALSIAETNLAIARREADAAWNAYDEVCELRALEMATNEDINYGERRAEELDLVYFEAYKRVDEIKAQLLELDEIFAALAAAKREYAAGRMEAALEKREGFRSLAFRSDLALEMYDGCHFAAVAFARQIVANL